MEHPVLSRILREGFVPLGWFAPPDMGETKLALLIGNAGPAMFRRFSREGGGTLDEWTRKVVDPIAQDLGATAVYPFDQPFLPFQQWARAAGAGHVSPLGLNIHSTYGLWHAYRAALLFSVAFDLALQAASAHPCETCAGKPCLSACPVSAFDGRKYDVAACVSHLNQKNDCMDGGCKARLACPIGKSYTYEPAQMQFHMRAFRAAHKDEL
jgi:epoxyqueuosine reductase QueG